ncbi:hypothetical protein ACFQU1_04985 [Chelatococcus sp. GCM10030263]|uniref:hypothetical protein n=1 Tax=Chelatococcus sp. GCM10030263 TaxID=3273387 RepID=UPI003617B81C
MGRIAIRKGLRRAISVLGGIAAVVAVVGALPARAQAEPPAVGTSMAPLPNRELPPAAAAMGHLTTSAMLGGTQTPIRSGLIWRVFRIAPGETRPEIVDRSNSAVARFNLPQGDYIVHATYGFASAVRRIALRGDADETVTINSGALKIAGNIGNYHIPPSKLTYSVYLPVGNDSEGRLVVANAHPGDLIRLPEGSYHVVSTYGDSNAIMRTDLKVEAGKVTEATINHRAATVTLKLVNTAGGEAFAGTAFSVLTPGGDVIREAIGAFPSFVLAEGDYVLIARHEGQVYTREFKVESGQDRDIEIVAR